MAINMKKIISFFATTLLLITIGGCADNMFASISEPLDPLDEANFLSIVDPNNATIVDSNNATIGDSKLLKRKAELLKEQEEHEKNI